METVAVLGLGKMGHAIALRLLRTGYNLVVWNRSYAKAKDLIGLGARWAETPAAAASIATTVFSMVSDDTASAFVWTGPDGAMQSMRPGSFAIECSTVSSNHLQKIAGIAAEKKIRFIDCPVTGLPDIIPEGKLTLLVGADPSDLEQMRPVLENISGTIRYFGPVGKGTAYKLIINLMGAVQIAALAEGIALAIRLGLDKEAVVNAIQNSAAASPQVVRHVRKMAALDFDADPGFTTTLRYKDARYGSELAASTGIEIPLGKAATKWLEQASLSAPEQDEAAIVECILSSHSE